MSFYNYRSHCGSLGGEIIRQAFAAVKDGSANDSQTARVQQIMDGSANKKQCSVVTNIHNGQKKGTSKRDGWDLRVKELVQYQDEHGDCIVPCNYPQNMKLAKWVSNQRT